MPSDTAERKRGKQKGYYCRILYRRLYLCERSDRCISSVPVLPHKPGVVAYAVDINHLDVGSNERDKCFHEYNGTIFGGGGQAAILKISSSNIDTFVRTCYPSLAVIQVTTRQRVLKKKKYRSPLRGRGEK